MFIMKSNDKSNCHNNKSFFLINRKYKYIFNQ